MNQEPVSQFQYKDSSDSESENRKKVVVVKEQQKPLDPHI